MKTQQLTTNAVPDRQALQALRAIEPQLVLVFGAAALLCDPALRPALREALPLAHLVGCSTAGEIGAQGVSDASLVLTAVHFDAARLCLAVTTLGGMDDSSAAGARLAAQLEPDGLHDVLLFGQGVDINGSALIDGLVSCLPADVRVAGGLAGDAAAFHRTWTLSTQAVGDRQLVALGIAGSSVRVRHGCSHGWMPFGPARHVTRSAGNVLYELDGEPALAVYRRYLGEHAAGLPATGLLFPFEMLGPDPGGHGLIRTILGIDERHGSLTLAGDILPGGCLKLMHASNDTLIEAAAMAGRRAIGPPGPSPDSLALLVSCVGRKLVMGGRIDEEVEAVAAQLGPGSCVTGFYAYGEIGPQPRTHRARLHNQTMTIALLDEAA